MKENKMDAREKELAIKSTVTLANANTLVSRIIIKIAGNDIGNCIGDTTISNSLISAMIQSRFVDKLS